jgi:hypothetical protein
MKTARRRDRKGLVVFLFPAILIFAVVIYGLVETSLNTSGVLVVRAETSGYYSKAVPLVVTATVGTIQVTTPENLTLPTGEYEVTFPAVQWYVTPGPITVAVTSSSPSYATGIYVPIVRHVAVSAAGFNVTSVTAYHGVTPVVWYNESDQIIRLVVGSSLLTIAPGSFGEKVFIGAGNETVSIYQQNASMVVDVT